MCFETRRSPEDIEGTRRLTSEDIRELFERYGRREPTKTAFPERAEEPERQREVALSER
jgi:hypothetical protein